MNRPCPKLEAKPAMKQKIFKLLLLVLTMMVALGADKPPVTAPLPSMGAAVFRMIGSLAVVIAIFFAAAWAFRNMHRFKGTAASQRKLQVLEAKTLGARQAIYVVGYEQQRLLIGATAQGLTLLTQLPEADASADAPPAERILPVSFGEALMQALGRK